MPRIILATNLKLKRLIGHLAHRRVTNLLKELYLLFLDDYRDFNLEKARCVNLLKAMELEDSEVEDSLSQYCVTELQEDDELTQLPLEWVEGLGANKVAKTHDSPSAHGFNSKHEEMLTDGSTFEEEVQNT